VLGIALIPAVIVLLVWGQGQVNRPSHHRPQLIVDESVGADFKALAVETWDLFLTAFQGRLDCFGDVRLRASSDLEVGAGYDPATATVTVRVPGTPAMLQSALVHEWAHHLEFQCPAHQELRPAFLAAQGLPPDAPWRPEDTPTNMPAGEWAGTPSEQYAEATIELVLGGRPIRTQVIVTQQAIRAIQAWASGQQ